MQTEWPDFKFFFPGCPPQDYLLHVINERHNLGEHTLFLQSDNWVPVVYRLPRLFVPETGALGLNRVRHTR